MTVEEMWLDFKEEFIVSTAPDQFVINMEKSFYAGAFLVLLQTDPDGPLYREIIKHVQAIESPILRLVIDAAQKQKHCSGQ